MRLLIFFVILNFGAYGALDKILITTGFNGSGNLNKSEIVNLKNPDNFCPVFEDFPVEVRAASGGLLAASVPVICGGYSAASLNPYSSLCYAPKYGLRGFLSRPRAYR